jgi:hypothetical protein
MKRKIFFIIVLSCDRFGINEVLDEDGDSAMGTLPKDCKYIYKMHLFVKDEGSVDDSNVYKIFLLTHKGKGNKFLPVKPSNLEETTTKLEKIYRLLLKDKVNLDLIVERVETKSDTIFQIVSTRLDIHF